MLNGLLKIQVEVIFKGSVCALYLCFSLFIKVRNSYLNSHLKTPSLQRANIKKAPYVLPHHREYHLLKVEGKNSLI